MKYMRNLEKLKIKAASFVKKNLVSYEIKIPF